MFMIEIIFNGNKNVLIEIIYKSNKMFMIEIIFNFNENVLIEIRQ